MQSSSSAQLKDHQAHVPLQAVLVADSFNERFMPLTHEQPRCLLPLVNVPLIEYTLEFLAVSGIEEVFVACAVHAEQITAYLRASRWLPHIVTPANRAQSMSPRIHLLVIADARSVGDVMRGLDARHVIEGDFVLVQGDIVSNVNLRRTLEAFKQRRELDRDVLMAMIMKRATPKHRSRSNADNAVLVVDPATQHVLSYLPVVSASAASLATDGVASGNGAEESGANAAATKKVSLDAELLRAAKKGGGRGLQVRNDLIDCQIDLCSNEVPPLFTENFDYGDIRRDFVKGILESDVLGKKIVLEELAGTRSSQYAGRVRTTRMYDAISRDVVSRWAFPLVPDHNSLLHGGSSYRYFPRSAHYREAGAHVAHAARLGSHVVLGAGSSVGPGSQLSHCVVGRNVAVGADCVLEGCYLFAGAVVRDGVRMRRCILGEGARVNAGAVLERGCLVGPRVVVGANVHLGPFMKVADTPQSSNSSAAAAASPQNVLGPDGHGFRWLDRVPQDEWDEEGEVGGRLVWQLGCEEADMARVDLGDDLSDSGGSSSGSEAEQYGASRRTSGRRPKLAGKQSQPQGKGQPQPHLQQRQQQQQTQQSQQSHHLSSAAASAQQKSQGEIRDTLQRAFRNGHDVEVAALEINGVKFSSNVGFRDVLGVVVPETLRFVQAESDAQPAAAAGAPKRTPSELAAALAALLGAWMKLWKKFTHGVDDMQEVLWLFTDFVKDDSSRYYAALSQVLMVLYQADVIEDEAFVAWHRADGRWARRTPATRLIRKKAERFIQWLEEDEEEEEEEEEKESGSGSSGEEEGDEGESESE